MPTKKKTPSKVNKKWFLDRLHERDMSMRELGRQIGLASASMSHLLNGTRNVKTGEVGKLANALRCEPAEVMRALGAPVESQRKVSVVGTVAGDGSVKMDGPGEDVEVPSDTPSGSYALLGQTAGGQPSLACFDGAVFIVGPSQDASQSVGRLVVADGRIAYVRRGIARGTCRMVGIMGEDTVASADGGVQPVLWIRP